MFQNNFSKYALSVCLITSQFSFSMEQHEALPVRGLLALGGLAVTGGITKMLSGNKFIDRHANKTGIGSGELAVVGGIMGGLFSLGNAIPEANTYGWLTPVLYASYKVANSNFLNSYFFANIPNVGEHIAGRSILETRQVLKASNSPFYNMRLLCVLNMIKKSGLDTAEGQDFANLYQQFDNNTKNMMTADEWKEFFNHAPAGQNLCEKWEMYYRKDKPFELTADNVGKVFFATAATTICIYEPAKIILRKAFDYPNCFINLSGNVINKISHSFNH